MADRVRKPEWLKINIGANDLTPKLKELSTPTACIRYAAVGVVPTWENAGEKELPHL
jgi:hypothetical protein